MDSLRPQGFTSPFYTFAENQPGTSSETVNTSLLTPPDSGNSHAELFNFVSSSSPLKNEIMATDEHQTSTAIDNGLSNEHNASAAAIMWNAASQQQQGKPRPATVHEGFSHCANSGYEALPWDLSALSQIHTPGEDLSRPISMHQDVLQPTTLPAAPWDQKPGEGAIDFQTLQNGLDINMGQAFPVEDAMAMFEQRFLMATMEHESMNTEPAAIDPRRLSGSSFTVSTSGAISELASLEDFSATLSEAPSYTSEFPPQSNRNSLMSTISMQFSPVASPRVTPQGRTELVRTQSRGRGSPSPRPMRTAPYSIDNMVRGNKRWSTGSFGPGHQKRPHSFMLHNPQDPFAPRLTSHHSSPTIQGNQVPLNYANLQTIPQQNPYLMHSNHAFARHGMMAPSQLPSQMPPQPLPPHFEGHPQYVNHGMFQLMHGNGNGDPRGLHGHYTDISDPPDLYASLHEEQIPPPPEDMNPSDPELVPHEQELRFDGDLYTPRWVRGHGNKREGWCGICKPGRWLVLKNSAFWYDKSFTHGVSAATGSPFNEPQETRRMDGNPDVWEGLCSACNEWIPLVSSKKKGTTWFRHAYKCHTHPKIKDAAKRRRETPNSRPLPASQMAKPKIEPKAVAALAKSSDSATMTASTNQSQPPVMKSQPHIQQQQQPPQQQQQQQQQQPHLGAIMVTQMMPENRQYQQQMLMHQFPQHPMMTAPAVANQMSALPPRLHSDAAAQAAAQIKAESGMPGMI